MCRKQQNLCSCIILLPLAKTGRGRVGDPLRENDKVVCGVGAEPKPHPQTMENKFIQNLQHLSI